MDKTSLLSDVIRETMTEKLFLKTIKMTAEEMDGLLRAKGGDDLSGSLLRIADKSGRFPAKKVLGVLSPCLKEFGDAPRQGRLENAYGFILGQLFPEKNAVNGQEEPGEVRSRLFLLQFLKALYKYERRALPFDPTREMVFLSPEEITKYGYTDEYLQLIRLADLGYLYEFMRLGAELTPFNTLGHIAGVHYVAMHLARQLAFLKIPVDLGLVSGAAAGHDIGKYGCKKSEEKRIPYLHYYYTDICFNRFNMPLMAAFKVFHPMHKKTSQNLRTCGTKPFAYSHICAKIYVVKYL